MSNGNRVANNTTVVQTSCGPGVIGSYAEKQWDGDDDPEHKRVNRYAMTYNTWRDELLDWGFTSNPGAHFTGTYVACFGGVISDACTLTDNDQLTLINRLGEEIRGHTFDAANSIGAEGKDALKQIAGAAMSFGRGMRDLKRGNVKSALNQFGLNPKKEKEIGLHKSLSSKVLATQLGWLPLMGDVQAASAALDALVTRDLNRTYVAKVKQKGFCHPATAPDLDIGEAVRRRKVTWTLSSNLSLDAHFSMSNPWDIADMVWNAATMSFIFDWWMPLGDFLNAKSIVRELTGSGYINDRYSYWAETSYVPPGHIVYSGKYFVRHTTFSRTPVASLQVPLPKFRDFNQIPSWRRALTAVSLAAQRLF